MMRDWFTTVDIKDNRVTCLTKRRNGWKTFRMERLTVFIRFFKGQ